MVKVLLVEDNHDVADSAIRALEMRGYQVSWAMTKQDAEAVIETAGPFDLAILDLNLPDGYGPELIDSLDKTTNVAVYSGLPDDAEAMCRKLGHDTVDVFSKGDPRGLFDWVAAQSSS